MGKYTVVVEAQVSAEVVVDADNAENALEAVDLQLADAVLNTKNAPDRGLNQMTDLLTSSLKLDWAWAADAKSHGKTSDGEARIKSKAPKKGVTVPIEQRKGRGRGATPKDDAPKAARAVKVGKPVTMVDVKKAIETVSKADKPSKATKATPKVVKRAVAEDSVTARKGRGRGTKGN